MAKQFGAAVRSRRKTLKWTQKALAAQVGCTDAYISEIENQRKEPGDELRLKIIEVLDLRDLPREVPGEAKVIAMTPAQSAAEGRPALALSFSALGEAQPDLELYRGIVAEALINASLSGWRPEGASSSEPSLGAASLSAAELIGVVGAGLVAQGFFSLPDQGPGEQRRWALLKLPLPEEGSRVLNAPLEKAFYLRRTLPDLAGFGPPPTLEYLPREFFPQRSLSRFELPERVAVLLFPIDDQGDALWDSRPVALEETALMRQGVRSARDMLDWCTLAHQLMSLVLGLHNAGWAHRDLSAHNILVRRAEGFLHDMRLIDFGSATPWGRPCPPFVDTHELWHWHPDRASAWGQEGQRGARRWTPDPRAEDIYALGALLSHLLVGASDRHPQQPDADGPEQRSWRVYRAQQIGDDLRFHIDEGRKHPERLPGALRGDLGRLYPLVHELIERAGDLQVDRLFEMLDAIDRTRTSAQHLLAFEGAPHGALTGDGPIEALLNRIAGRASLEEPERWCEAYTDLDPERIKARIRPLPWIARALGRLDTPLPPEAMDVDQALADCMELVRLGFARYATDTLAALLRLGPTEDPDRDIRMLRVAVGELLLREPDVERARLILGHFDDSEAPERTFIDHIGHRRWWVELFKARLALLEDNPDAAQHALERLPIPDPEHFPRAWIAHLKLETLFALQTRQPLGDLRQRLVMARRWTLSIPESLLTTALLARCDAAQGQLSDALRWINLGLGEAAAREFPVEYGELLALSASLVRDAAESPRRRAALQREGARVESLMAICAELSARAASLFGALGIHRRLQRALLVAGDCARMAGDARAAVEHLCLASANASLGLPTDPDVLKLLAERAELLQDDTDEDPGVRAARAHYDRHGDTELALWGGERLGFEAHNPAQAGLGALLGRLVDRSLPTPPDLILDVGCGVGADARALALRFPEARVVGIDVSPWCIREARKRHPVAPGRLAFHCVPHEALLQGRLSMGTPDLILLRNTLSCVSFRRPFLSALRDLMEPGGILLLLDTVQRHPSAPAPWRRVMAATHTLGLETPRSTQALLRASGFEALDATAEDHSALLRAFLDARLDWFTQARDREARRIHERPGEAERVRSSLEALREALTGPQASLGWIATAARAR